MSQRSRRALHDAHHGCVWVSWVTHTHRARKRLHPATSTSLHFERTQQIQRPKPVTAYCLRSWCSPADGGHVRELGEGVHLLHLGLILGELLPPAHPGNRPWQAVRGERTPLSMDESPREPQGHNGDCSSSASMPSLAQPPDVPPAVSRGTPLASSGTPYCSTSTYRKVEGRGWAPILESGQVVSPCRCLLGLVPTCRKHAPGAPVRNAIMSFAAMGNVALRHSSLLPGPGQVQYWTAHCDQPLDKSNTVKGGNRGTHQGTLEGSIQGGGGADGIQWSGTCEAEREEEESQSEIVLHWGPGMER